MNRFYGSTSRGEKKIASKKTCYCLNYLPSNLLEHTKMALRFKDDDTIVVNEKLLELCEPGQFIQTSKRSTGYNNLFWWLQCYPNGDTVESKGHVSVFVFTSIGGLELKFAFTIDNSDIKKLVDFRYYEDTVEHGCPKLVSHENVLSEGVIVYGVIIIRCRVNFQFEPTKLTIPAPRSESTIICKLNRKTVETFKPGQSIIEEERTVDGITWWIVCYPCSNVADDGGYLTLLFCFTGGPITVKVSCDMSIGGVLIHKQLSVDFQDTENTCKAKWFSHKQCQLADHNDAVVDLMCNVSFDTPVQAIPADPMPSAFQFEDTETIKVKVDCFDLFETGQCFQTDKKPTGHKNLQWWIICYPNGDSTKNKGHVGVCLRTSIGSLKANMSIVINGLGVKGKTNSYFENPVQTSWPKLASHKEILSGSIIQNDEFVIRCKIDLKMDYDDAAKNSIIAPVSWDYCTINFDRRTLETYKPGQKIVNQKRTQNDITWWVEYYPCGRKEKYKNYVSVYFCIAGGPITVEYCCAMSIGDAVLQKIDSDDFNETDNWGNDKWFSHRQIKLADHDDDIIKLACVVEFNTPVQTIPNDPTQTEPPKETSVFEKEKDVVIENFRRCHPTDAKDAEKFNHYLTSLCKYYNYFKRSRFGKSSSGESLDQNIAMFNQNYYFFHIGVKIGKSFGWLAASPPCAKTVQMTLLKPNTKFCEITATDLFTNFNKASPGRPVGAFTHCLYKLMLQRDLEEIENYGPEYIVDYIIVTGIDHYVSDDGFEEVYNLLHPNNLSQYYDEAMPNLRIDAAAINFVFTCRKLPELLIWRLAENFKENVKYEPELHITKRKSLETGFNTVSYEPWKIDNVNCRNEIVKKIQSILDFKEHAILSLKMMKVLQNELRRWYQNWRVCGMERPPIWRSAAPCLIYKKAACGKTWYLVFYAPLEWSEKLLNSASYECGESNAEVEQKFKNFDAITTHNNLNTAEQGLNKTLDYPTSLFFHQNATVMDHCGILVTHRKAYKSVNANYNYGYLCKKLMQEAIFSYEPFKSALFAIQQVADSSLSRHETLTDTLPKVFRVVKRLLSGSDQNHLLNKKYEVILCYRNTSMDVGDQQSKVITVGPIKVVVIEF